MSRHLISRSIWRKLAIMCVAIVGFVLLYEATTFDSRDAAPSAAVDPTLPAAGSRVLFTATAYCKGRTTASGVNVRTGIAASDPAILPVGSVVNVSTDNAKYNGVYTIMDTGPRVQGRVLDLYMWSCHEALAFGRRPIEVTVLRLGWNPNASTPSLVDRLFRRREAAARQGAPVSDGATVRGASDGAKVDGAPVQGAPEPTVEPSHPAPSDAPPHPAPPHPAP
jgi:3D (Asp-Asp-Asp) domain-containing protein